MAAKLHKKWGIVMVNRKCISVVDLLMSKLLERKEKVKVKLCMSRIVKTRYVLIGCNSKWLPDCIRLCFVSASF